MVDFKLMVTTQSACKLRIDSDGHEEYITDEGDTPAMFTSD